MIYSVKGVCSLNNHYLTCFFHLMTRLTLTQQDLGHGWGKEEELSTEDGNRTREQGCLTPPTRDVIVNRSTHQRIFSVESWDVFVCHPGLLAIAGVSDANCHNEFLDLHAEYYDTILEDTGRLGKTDLSSPALRAERSKPKANLTTFPLIDLN